MVKKWKYLCNEGVNGSKGYGGSKIDMGHRGDEVSEKLQD